jgi:hypothetical protein
MGGARSFGTHTPGPGLIRQLADDCTRPSRSCRLVTVSRGTATRAEISACQLDRGRRPSGAVAPETLPGEAHTYLYQVTQLAQVNGKSVTRY